MDEIDHIEMEMAEAGEIEEGCGCPKASWCAKMPGHDGDCSVVVLRADSPVAVEQSLTAELAEARTHIVAQDELIAKLQQRAEAADMRIGAATEILQMLLQSPLGSDDAHKALSMAGAWLVMGSKS